MSEKSKVYCHRTFVISYYVSIWTWENSDKKSLKERRWGRLDWCSFSPLSSPSAFFLLFLNLITHGEHFFSLNSSYVSCLYSLGCWIWIAFWLLLLNLFNIISLSNLLMHPVTAESGRHPEHLDLPSQLGFPLHLTGPSFASISTS